MKALLICQDPDEAAILSLVLQRAGLTINRQRTMGDSLGPSSDVQPELIVVVHDEGTPLQLVKQIRSKTQAPLIAVSDALDETAHALALESGADLVLMRPFSTRLLISQVKALMRRAANQPFYTLPSLSAHGLELDPATHTVTVEGHPLRRLTQLEFRLLYTLMIHREQVLPTEVLVEQVWGYSGDGERNLVRGLIRRLRMKVEPDPHNPQFVITVPGIGYTFSPEA